MTYSGLVVPAPTLDTLGRIKPKALGFAELPPARAVVGAFPLDRRSHGARDRLVWRIRAEFQEMPGVSLTLAQARRLFGIPLDACNRILNQLADEGMLRRRLDGSFGRSDVRP
jgi:hypothetical protein